MIVEYIRWSGRSFRGRPGSIWVHGLVAGDVRAASDDAPRYPAGGILCLARRPAHGRQDHTGAPDS